MICGSGVGDISWPEPRHVTAHTVRDGAVGVAGRREIGMTRLTNCTDFGAAVGGFGGMWIVTDTAPKLSCALSRAAALGELLDLIDGLA